MANQANQAKQAKQAKQVSHKTTQGYRDLRVWQESYQLALSVYRLASAFPREHRYELTSQLNRAALSVPTNITEGCGAIHRAEFIQFLNIALRSVNEVEMLLRFASDLELLETPRFQALESSCQNIRRMMIGLIKSIEQRG